jgi:hypothetical protein
MRIDRDPSRQLAGFVHSFCPELAGELSEQERLWIDRLNRLGMAYFRPLVMVVLSTGKSETQRIQLFQL